MKYDQHFFINRQAEELDSESAHVSWLARGAWTIIGLGFLLRLLRLAADRNLWLDELMLAHEVLTRPLASLAQPLNKTGAPVGFLVMTRLAVDTLGDHDWVLRLLPFLAGCTALVLLYRVSLRLLTPRGVMFVLAMLAVVEPAVYYSGEFKQYSIDLAFTLAILLVALRACHSERFAGRFFVLGLVGTASVWFSFPAVFVLAGAGVTLLALELLAGRWRAAVALLAVGGAWLGSFVAVYLLTLRGLIGNEFLQDAWSSTFMPSSPVAMVSWQVHALGKSFGNDTLGIPEVGAAVLAAVLGVVDLARRRPEGLGFILLPIAFAMAASAFNLFPFGGRQILFLAPCLALLVAAGMDVLLREPQPMARLAGVLLVLVIMTLPVERGVRAAFEEQSNEEIVPVLKYVATHWQPGDLLYLYYGAQLGYERYANRVGMPASVTPIVGVRSRGDWLAHYEDVAKLAGSRRVWVIVSHFWAPTRGGDERIIVRALDHMGQRLEAVREPGASAYLYDLHDVKADGAHP